MDAREHEMMIELNSSTKYSAAACGTYLVLTYCVNDTFGFT